MDISEKKKLLVIGGTGSLGTRIIQQLSDKYDIYVISRDENKQWKLKQEYPHITFILGNMRNKSTIEEKLYAIRPNKIIIAAALKHIDICEYNVAECIQTNIIGVQNVVDTIANISNKNMLPELEVVCFVSTDKATSPVNVYGMCKSVAERLIVEKSLTISKPKFVVVRYGNVLNSRGSIIPLFTQIAQDENKKFFTVTHPGMTRFFLSLEDGINLIEKAMDEGESGDTYVPVIHAFKIIDIAKYFSKKYNKPIKIMGIRPGEKLHECLINESERYRTIKKGDVYVIKPCYKEIEPRVDFEFEYTSNIALGANVNSIL